MKLVWSHYALSDRDDIFTYIRAENPKVAVLMDQRIAFAARRLLEFPESGRTGRIAGTRELVVPRTPYIVAYVVLPDRIRILRILHGPRMWPDELSKELRRMPSCRIPGRSGRAAKIAAAGDCRYRCNHYVPAP